MLGAVATYRGPRIELSRLAAWAAEFDRDADGAHYSARTFVRWVEQALTIDPGAIIGLQGHQDVDPAKSNGHALER